ncbi:galactofuranose ABC transporter, permease protein YjfF [Xanthomonas translucens]|uniref:galactofuranose ABC transporter, permease protein YjfF n=1 Tax=Xanthomonas campestris pv. translucens TaxID=343 RepID=UPI00071E88E1|nr:galactofuranose ABC transporter, permease protein YjfF [Xanthomonas translucens]AVY67589.1 ABC transporter permease [Xanthomonas translucens pv. undulosa]QSQ53372.1 sugar ABC transporter permease YjfF [Xanthomonas translucens pv. undulosa]QSQ61011.1 sugar ABC transporter permease YjfF [Xanthomonas translucens pv. undulosa]WLA11341.1 sugar ABC transporter permease YjfF [Xanthomonas translucens]
MSAAGAPIQTARGLRRAGTLLHGARLPLAITVALFVAMVGAGGVLYDGFLSPQVFANLLIDNAFLCIAAVGMTFVILSGGIDLSVGAVIAFTTVLSASLVQRHGWSPLAAIPLLMLLGALFGAFMGTLIQRYRLQPFVVTLAGMFLARGASYLISVDSIPIDDALYVAIAQFRVPIGAGASLSIGALIALVTVALGMWLAHCTRFGRCVYALGGSEASARLMGLPVAATQIKVYAFSGFCSALAGVVCTFYMLSGYSLHALGLELDAIAAVVIGGSLLAGGSGYVIGTLFGVLMLGVIQTLIVFDGTLSSWWTRIVIGALLLLFCLMQRLLTRRTPDAGADP